MHPLPPSDEGIEATADDVKAALEAKATERLRKEKLNHILTSWYGLGPSIGALNKNTSKKKKRGDGYTKNKRRKRKKRPW